MDNILIVRWIQQIIANNPTLFSLLRRCLDTGYSKRDLFIKNTLYTEDNALKVLDMGCGTGESRKLFCKYDYTGIDISPAFIRHARRKHPGKYYVMDATQLQFKDESYDIILIAALLHHLNDKIMKKVLSEVHRVLKPSGKIILLENARIPELTTFLVTFIQKLDRGDYIRTPQQYAESIKGNFQIESEISFKNGYITYYGMVLMKKNE